MRSFLFLLIFLFCIDIHAYDLSNTSNLSILKNCPFMHGDANSLNISQVNNLVRSHLKTKIEGNQKCEAEFRKITQNFDSIDSIFSLNQNPSLITEIKQDILNQRLNGLEAERLMVDDSSPAYLDLTHDYNNYKRLLADNHEEISTSRAVFNEQRNNKVLSRVFNHLSDSMTTMANLDPECMSQLGGWETMLPVVLNIGSSLSSLGGTAYSSAIGAGLKVISNFTHLFRDIKAKRALKKLLRHKNSRMLACTYYAIQNTACEYKRNLGLSKNSAKIKKIIHHRYDNKNTEIYDEFFHLRKHVRDFEAIFFEISAMGSAITLDVDVMTKYFRAKRSSPDTILNANNAGPPPNDSDDSTDADFLRQAWLIKVKARGISYQTRDTQGNLKTLKQQVSEALTDITNKKAEIKSVENLVKQIRSFIDLKHRLDREPAKLIKVARFKAYLNKALNQKIAPTKNLGLIVSALRILEALEKFLSVKYQDFVETQENNDEEIDKSLFYENYTEQVNVKGRELFQKMSEGAVAQVDQQTILTIGSIVQERLEGVFVLLEEEFYHQELNEIKDGIIKDVSYTSYKRDLSILMNVIQELDSFSGSGIAFRSEDVSVASKSFEKGFRKEAYKMVKSSLRETSTYYPELKDQTASHLCALFSTMMSKKSFFRKKNAKVLKECKKRFRKLDLYGLFEKKSLEIDWSDPCFYFKYQNLLETQKLLYENMLDYGFLDSVRGQNRPSQTQSR